LQTALLANGRRLLSRKKENTMAYQMSPELLNDVRRLIDAVRGYLNNDDGSDDRFIVLMQEHVSSLEHRLARSAS
jgi:hypothetical protein